MALMKGYFWKSEADGPCEEVKLNKEEKHWQNLQIIEALK